MARTDPNEAVIREAIDAATSSLPPEELAHIIRRASKHIGPIGLAKVLGVDEHTATKWIESRRVPQHAHKKLKDLDLLIQAKVREMRAADAHKVRMGRLSITYAQGMAAGGKETPSNTVEVEVVDAEGRIVFVTSIDPAEFAKAIMRGQSIPVRLSAPDEEV